jgi:hypothetical protein
MVAGLGVGLAEMVAQLGTHHALNQCLLEGQRGRVNLLASHRSSDDLVHQLLRDLRQSGAARSDLRVLLFRSADWRKCSWSVMLCLT